MPAQKPVEKINNELPTLKQFIPRCKQGAAWGYSNSNRLTISSQLTFVIKYFISSFIILLFLCFILFFCFIEVNNDARIFAIIFGILFLTGIVWMIRNICFIVKIQYDDKYLYIDNNVAFKLEEVKEVKKKFPIFYQIKIDENNKFLFIPHYFELMSNIFSIPKSVLELKSRVEKLRNKQ